MLRSILNEHNVSTTAALANYWKHEAGKVENWPDICQAKGNRTKPLFKDNLMQYFIDEAVCKEAEVDAGLNKKMWLSLATRTRFFRQTISKHIDESDIKQILVLGSGFDTLAARKLSYTNEKEVAFFEIDQANLLKCKASIYHEHAINKNAEYIGLDYVKGDLIGALKSSSLDSSKPTLILWEGNTFYLEKDDVVRVLKDLSKHFHHVIITFDFLHEDMKNKAAKLDEENKDTPHQTTLDNFKKRNSPFKTFFNPDELKALCSDFGLKCIDETTAYELAKTYEVDNNPFPTGKTYLMATFQK
jgi:methyltransferase (TIGR00027 family)